MKISSITIARNEENNIARCIKSLSGCIDEIVVIVDDSTTDNTLQIAHSLGAVCRVSPWLGYAETKRLAVSLTANDWILWIDADEALTEELRDEILRFKSSIPQHSAYSISRKADFLGRWIMHSGWYPGRVTRLFNKQKAGFSEKDVHEHLVVNGTVGMLEGDLEHYTDPSIQHYFNKFNNYTTLAADELVQKGKRAGLNDILLRPLFIFFKMYILKKGFLDGIHGFILAAFSSMYVFVKYTKVWEKQKSTSGIVD